MLDDFMAWIDERPVQPTTIINDLYTKLNTIDMEISNLIARLNAAEMQRTAINDLCHKIYRDKKAFDDAKSEKEKKEAAMVILEERLMGIENEIKEDQEKIEQLCLQYEGLAISKSFASYIEAMVHQRREVRVKAAAPQEELDRLEKLIDDMKKRYEIVAGGTRGNGFGARVRDAARRVGLTS
ncbi:hypothetical protein AX17_005442 [Amanita inopinata Kibby_2008]|nr:hypothetical protein AX17_005442 [Amanita inopinata Kibby_2008]